MSRLDDLLRGVSEPDQLHKLIEKGPALFEALTSTRPHRSKVIRVSGKGILGVRLRTVDDGRCRFTCTRWVAMFLCEVDDARRAANAAKPTTKPARRTRTSSTTDEDEATLARFGVGQGSDS